MYLKFSSASGLDDRHQPPTRTQNRRLRKGKRRHGNNVRSRRHKKLQQRPLYPSSGREPLLQLVGDRQLAVQVPPLPLVEVWEELQPEVEHLTGIAGLKIIRKVIEDQRR